MKIKFFTFGEGHLVSTKEFDRLKKGFAKVGMELYRHNEEVEPDIIMVKGFSHTYQDLPQGKPIVYYSIGTEWKVGDFVGMSEPVKDLYLKSDAVVHISDYCKLAHHKVFGRREDECVIIPAEEPKLPVSYQTHEPLKLATTCIPRPIKRTEEVERLCKKHGIELVPAWGGVSDFSYYHDCDGYIHLSRKEGMPNTVLEALAYGLPCIVTNYGGAKEAVGDAGVVINNDPPDDVILDLSRIEPVDDFLFEEALNKFKTNLPELRLRVRERVLSQLNDLICAERFKEIFTKCLK